MKEILKNHLVEIQQLCRSLDVEQLYVFGSVLGDQFSEQSDIDFIVDFSDLSVSDYTAAYFKLCDALELLLKRPVDLVTVRSIKNPYFKQETESTRQLIYSKQAA